MGIQSRGEGARASRRAKHEAAELRCNAFEGHVTIFFSRGARRAQVHKRRVTMAVSKALMILALFGLLVAVPLAAAQDDSGDGSQNDSGDDDADLAELARDIKSGNLLQSGGDDDGSGDLLQSQRFKEPWFYHDLEGPRFKTLAEAGKYSIRKYPHAKYATTTVEDTSYNNAVAIASKRLIDYGAGRNDGCKGQRDGCKMDFTVPFITEVYPKKRVKENGKCRQGNDCLKNTYTFSYYIPDEHLKNPPKPKSKHIDIVKYPPSFFAVKSYGGYNVGTWNVEKQLWGLVDNMRKLGLDYDRSQYWFSVYDLPLRPTGRHNEVWVKLQA